jgi:hypothetical protein
MNGGLKDKWPGGRIIFYSNAAGTKEGEENKNG